ncbi:hypothetical protein J5N97_005301 [Dioscorea zingiberensis]|uniref:Uncharacterized protein n=1 Tax=Dioscorea zingiberensis TaxID=325984 RepID=A0A9D5D7S9_9LILI|nr:hypothetical protein J5N97_005301 [Dioscorea zingiberensis]
MGNRQSQRRVGGTTTLCPYVHLSSSTPPSQLQPLLAADEHSETSNSNLTSGKCTRECRNEIEAMHRSYTDLAKKVDELERKERKDNGADIKRIYEIIADQDKQIKRLKELVEAHGKRNAALAEMNATTENTINQSIPDLISFEPITWDLPPPSVASLQEANDFFDDVAGGIVIVIFLLSVLLGLNL